MAYLGEYGTSQLQHDDVTTLNKGGKSIIFFVTYDGVDQKSNYPYSYLHFITRYTITAVITYNPRYYTTSLVAQKGKVIINFGIRVFYAVTVFY